MSRQDTVEIDLGWGASVKVPREAVAIIRKPLERQVAMLREACATESHNPNDFNCPSDPYADECGACRGADLRRAALVATAGPKEEP